jgi:protein-S-isoprenylcysteine O-methyltransferase Ste14
MHSPRRLALVVAWTGAAAFAASLAWFLYCYLVVFGRPAAPGTIAAPLAVDALLFTAFALHHSLLARTRAKDAVRRLAPPELERSIYTWVASLLFGAVCFWWQPVPGTLYELTGPARAAGWLVQALGLVLTLHASRALDVLDLAGVRAVERAAEPPASVEPPLLNTRGLYGFVRHPMYFAWALVVFGTPVMTGTRAAFAVISTAYLMLAIPFEERSLVQTFGDDYLRYSEQVRYRMLPGVY